MNAMPAVSFFVLLVLAAITYMTVCVRQKLWNDWGCFLFFDLRSASSSVAMCSPQCGQRRADSAPRPQRGERGCHAGKNWPPFLQQQPNSCNPPHSQISPSFNTDVFFLANHIFIIVFYSVSPLGTWTGTYSWDACCKRVGCYWMS